MLRSVCAACAVFTFCWTPAAHAEPLPLLTMSSEGFISGRIRDVAISDDGLWVAAAEDKQVRVWDVKRQKLHAVPRGYQHEVTIGQRCRRRSRL